MKTASCKLLITFFLLIFCSLVSMSVLFNDFIHLCLCRKNNCEWPIFTQSEHAVVSKALFFHQCKETHLKVGLTKKKDKSTDR